MSTEKNPVQPGPAPDLPTSGIRVRLTRPLFYRRRLLDVGTELFVELHELGRTMVILDQKALAMARAKVDAAAKAKAKAEADERAKAKAELDAAAKELADREAAEARAAAEAAAKAAAEAEARAKAATK